MKITFTSQIPGTTNAGIYSWTGVGTAITIETTNLDLTQQYNVPAFLTTLVQCTTHFYIQQQRNGRWAAGTHVASSVLLL